MAGRSFIAMVSIAIISIGPICRHYNGSGFRKWDKVD